MNKRGIYLDPMYLNHEVVSAQRFKATNR